MSAEEFFKKWSAICSAHESCTGCPMDDDTPICIACSKLERAIKELEHIMSLQKKEKQ